MKTKNIFKKALILFLLFSLLIPTLVGCGGEEAGEPTKLSFKAASGYDYLKTLDGSLVTINGYMATSSPVDGSFIFLMNLPYQSCPFCVPNTNELSNTMEVYPKKGDKFDYTDRAIKIVGRLEVAENPDEPFKDDYGYTFNYRIVDAEYTVLSAEELSGNFALYQKIADSGVINEIYRMYDYLNFVCKWNTYYVKSYINDKGEKVEGFYLWPADAKGYIYKDGAQYNYGYKDGYFDSIIAKIEKADPEAFSELVENIRAAEALAKRALSELDAGNYTSEKKYLEMFGREDYVYTLNAEGELSSEMDRIYEEFSNWLGSLEM